MPHRLIRRHLVGLLMVVLTGQISGLPVSVVQGLGVHGKADAMTCCCCRRGAAGHCPMCSRTPHVAARCTCGCQGHDTALPPLLDLEAVVPSPTAVFADRTAVDAPSVAAPRVAGFIPVPPSPPPWAASPGVLL